MASRVYASVAMLLAGAALLCGAAFPGPAANTPEKSTTLRVALPTDVDHVDPALAYALSSWNMESDPTDAETGIGRSDAIDTPVTKE